MWRRPEEGDEPRHKRTPRRDDQRAAEIVHPGDKGITPTRELTEGRSPKDTEENLDYKASLSIVSRPSNKRDLRDACSL